MKVQTMVEFKTTHCLLIFSPWVFKLSNLSPRSGFTPGCKKPLVLLEMRDLYFYSFKQI